MPGGRSGPPPLPCQREACSIQACLDKHSYDDQKCQKEIELMRLCCKRVEYKSYICDGFNPDKIKTNKNKKSS